MPTSSRHSLTTLGASLTALGGLTFLLELTFVRGAVRSLLLPEYPHTRLLLTTVAIAYSLLSEIY